MKKLPALALIVSILAGSAGAAFAANSGFEGPGAQEVAAASHDKGFNHPDARKVTVAEALKLPDDSRVILRGNLVKQIDKKNFEFKDSTGTINAEISAKRFEGLKVTPQDEIEVEGKIDVERNKTEVDVKSIRLAK